MARKRNDIQKPRLVARHSILLALEPRQVFDGAVGAAIAEVLAGPETHQSQAQPSQADDHSPAADAHTDHPAAADDQGRDFITAFGGDFGIFSSGNKPVFYVDGDSTTILGDTSFNLSNIIVSDLDADEVHNTFTLTADKGSFSLISGKTAVSGVSISGDGKLLTITNKTAADINTALANYQFALPKYQSGTAEIIYYMDDPATTPLNGLFEVAVTPVPHDPELIVDNHIFPDTVKENTTTTIRGITVSNPDGGGLMLTIEATRGGGGAGGFDLGTYPGVTIVTNETGKLVLKGTADQLNSILTTLNYNSSTAGKVDFTFTLEVQGGTGQPIVVDGADYEVIVNDPPTISDKNFTGALEENSNYANPAKTSLPFDKILVADRNTGDILTVELKLTGGAGVGRLYGAYSGSAVYTMAGDGQSLIITGSAADVQAALAATTFKGDYKKHGDLKLDIKVTDQWGATASIDQRIISVTPVNDPPVVNVPTDPTQWLAIFEGGSNNFNASHFGITDPDTPDDKVIITLTSLPTYGSLFRGGSMLGKGASFSLAELKAGAITYRHGVGPNVPTNQVDLKGQQDGFRFTVDDGSVTNPVEQAIKVRLNPVNDDFSVGVEYGGTEGGQMLLWVWERQKGASLAAGHSGNNDVLGEGGIRLYTGDDPVENFKITVDSVPDPAWGKMYLDLNGTEAGRVYLAAGSVFYGDQLQYLRYDATDREPGDTSGGVAPPSFRLTFEDRSPVGGLQGKDPSIYDYSRDEHGPGTVNKHSYDFLIKVVNNNDDPVLDTNTGLGTTANPYVVDGSRLVQITGGMLHVTDVDSNPKEITYTVKEVGSPLYGQLLISTDGVTFGVLTVGSSFTQDDIDQGRIYYEWQTAAGVPKGTDGHDGARDHYDLDTYFKFVVMDGAVTSWPDSSHAGGIYGDYGPDNAGNPYAPNQGPANLKPFTFDMHLLVYAGEEGTHPSRPENVRPVIEVDNTLVPRISEAVGSATPPANLPSTYTLTGTKYTYDSGGVATQVGSAGWLSIKDPDTAPESLVISLLNSPTGGNLYLNGSLLYVGGKFTYADVLAGKVTYRHDGSECFQENLVFSVSDGVFHVDKTGADGAPDRASITLHLDIVPYNDAPSFTVDTAQLITDEGQERRYFDSDAEWEAYRKRDDARGALVLGGGWYELGGTGNTGGIFRFSDPDGAVGSQYEPRYNPDGTTLRPAGSFEPDDLSFVINEVDKPAHGVLQIKSGGVWTDAVFISGELALTRAQIEGGQFRYLHDGSDDANSFTDSFKITLRDNSTEVGGSKEVTQTVNITVRRINDPPSLEGLKSITGLDHNGNPVREGDKVILGGKTAVEAGRPGLYATDSDNEVAQIHYVITKACEYGTLYLDGVPLGVGSDFTQADIDAGRVYYQDNGLNQHKDSFEFKLSDGSAYYKGGAPVTFDIDIVPVNDPVGFEGLSQKEVFYQGTGSPMPIIDNTTAPDDPERFVQIWDKDNGDDYVVGVTKLNDYMELTITAYKNSFGSGIVMTGTTLAVGSSTGLTVETAGGQLVLKGKQSDINAALKTLTFNGNGDLNETAYLRFVVNDCNNGGEAADGFTNASTKAMTAVKDLAVHVSTQNDAPTAELTAGGASVTVREDTNNQIFCKPTDTPGANQVKLVFSDADAFDAATNTATISAFKYGTTTQWGTLSFTGGMPDGLKKVEIVGGELILTGTIEAINKALSQVRYQAPTDQSGQATLKVVYNDQANLGEGGAKTVTQNVTIHVLAVNDAPTVTLTNFDKTQVDEGKKVPTLEIIGEGGQTVGTHYEVKLDGKIKIDDAKDFANQDSNNPDNKLSRDDAAKPVTVTLTATQRYGGGAKGYFVLANGETLPSGVTMNVVGNTVTLEGSWNAVQAALDKLAYAIETTDVSTVDMDLNLVKINVKVDDHLNGDETGLTPASANRYAESSFLVNINVVDNRAPAIDGGDITIYEDMYGVTDPKGINLYDYIKTQNPGHVFGISDPDSFLQKLCYSITLSGSGGTLYLGTTAKPDGIVDYPTPGTATWAESGKTVADLEGVLRQIYFKPDADWNGTIDLVVKINDKGNTGKNDTGDPDWNSNKGLVTETHFAITVKPVNDRPETAAGQTVNVTAVNEDSTPASISGDLVSALFAGKLTDPHDSGAQTGALGGILVVADASTPAQGHWEYQVNGGSWTPMPGGLGATNALYLAADAKLRFVPEADFYGAPGQLTVHLVETMPVRTPYGDPAGNPAYPTLTSGFPVNIVTDLDGVGAVYRSYTANTVLVGTTISPVNDAPEWVTTGTPASYVVDEDRSITLTGLKFADKDIRTPAASYPNDDRASYTMTLTVGHGALTATAQTGVTIAGSGTGVLTLTGKLADINALLTGNKVSYKGTANYYGGDNVRLTVSDGGNAGGGGALQTPLSPAPLDIPITVNPMNDAPVLNTGYTNGQVLTPFPAIDEDTASTASKTVTEIFGPAYKDAVDQQHGVHAKPEQYAFAGVLVTGNLADANVDGYWEYKTSTGSWTTLPKPGTNEAIYLDKDTQLRFVPKADYHGQAGQLTVRLADGTVLPATAAGAGTIITLPATGAETPYSDASNTLKLSTTINPVNDAPEWVTTGLPSGGYALSEDRTLALTGLKCIDKDIRTPATSYPNDDRASYTVTLTVGHGVLAAVSQAGVTVSGNNTGTVILTGKLADINTLLAATNGIVYKPAANYYGGDTLSMTVNDGGNAGDNGALQTPLEATHSVGITVNPMNDAPVLNTGYTNGQVLTPFPAIDEDTASTTSKTVTEIFGPAYKDAVDQQHGVHAKPEQYAFAGVLVMGNLADASVDGVWEYKTSTGSWTTLPKPGTNEAIYLDKDTQLRFVPKADYHGQAGQLTVRLADGTVLPATAAGAGTIITLPATGAETPYSDANNTLKLGTTINSVNDAPEWGTTGLPASYTLNEDRTLALTGLKFIDKDIRTAADDRASYTVTLSVTQGVLTAGAQAGVTVSGNNTGTVILTGKLADINTLLAAANGIVYKPTANYYGGDTLSMTVNDGGNAGDGGALQTPLEATHSVGITVSPMNDAPVLNNGYTNGLVLTPFPAIDEDTANTAAKTVDEIFGPAYKDAVDQQHGAHAKPEQYTFAGVLVTGNLADASVDGVWQYSTDGGGSWTSLPKPGTNEAVYLDKDTQLRFVPKADYHGQAGQLTVRLADGTVPPATAAGAGAIITLPATGAETPYSDANNTLKLSTTINPVNDAPEWVTTGLPASYVVNEDAHIALSGLKFIDKDIRTSADDRASYTVTLNVTQGALTAGAQAGVTISGNNTGTVTLTGKLADINALLAADKITYTPAGNYYGADNLHLTVNDGGNAGDGGALQTPQDATLDVPITVNPVNDAPVRVGDALLEKTVLGHNGDPGYTPMSWTVANLAALQYTDPNDLNFGDGSQANQFTGIVITGFPSLPAGTAEADGQWQFKLAGTGDWVDFPANLSLTNALYLPQDAEVRFMPAAGSVGARQFTCLLVETGGAPGLVDGQTYDASGDQNGGVSQISKADNPLTVKVWTTFSNANAPAVHEPAGPLTVREDTPLAITGWSVTDADVGDMLTVTLTVGHGTLNFVDGQGVTATGHGTGALVLQGKPADINAAIAAGKLTYQGVQDYYGPDALTINAHDMGGTAAGPGGHPVSVDPHQAASKTVVIDITPVNDAPVVTTPGQTVFLPELIPGRGDGSQSQTVDALFGNVMDDHRDGPSHAGHLAGVLIVGDLSTPGQGHWEYSLDGQIWQSIPAGLDPANALYLDAAASLRFMPVKGFSGQPGPLTMHLVETMPVPNRAPYGDAPGTDWPTLTSGGTVDIAHSGLDAVAAAFRGYTADIVNLSICVKADAKCHIPGQCDNPPSPDNGGFNDWRYKEAAPTVVTRFEREGLDSPQYRTSGAIDGRSQEANLIVRTHIGTVVGHTTEYLGRSVGRCLNGLCAPMEVSRALTPAGPQLTLLQDWFWTGEGDFSLTLDPAKLTDFLTGPPSFKATQANGDELPPWLRFDPEELKLELLDPAQLVGEFPVLITVTDDQGHTVVMKLSLKPQPREAADGAAAKPDMTSSLENGRFLRDAAASFEALWADWTRPQGDEAAALAHDGDLDQTLTQVSTVDRLWLEAKRLLTELAS